MLTRLASYLLDLETLCITILPYFLAGHFFLYNSHMSSSTSVRTLLDIYRGARDGVYNVETGSAVILSGAKPHTDFSADYSTEYLQKTINNSVITSRFSAPGGIEVMTKGYQDFRSSEFSVYNGVNTRNLTVRRPFQGVSSSVVSETQGIRISDIESNWY